MKQLTFLFTLLILISCSSNESCNDCELVDSSKDTIQKQAPVEDTMSSVKGKITEQQEKSENHAKIVKKYGEQWDFCTCVVANDSINDAFEKGGMTPAQEEKLMARWEYVENKCKEMLTNPNTTPDERAKHDKKVLKCLKQYGLKK
ncbi:MAG TPA: hypothetical protein PLI97_02500 [Fluviicola sp.]|nr:hypothetical protein [Fluviicola sp.]